MVREERRSKGEKGGATERKKKGRIASFSAFPMPDSTTESPLFAPRSASRGLLSTRSKREWGGSCRIMRGEPSPAQRESGKRSSLEALYPFLPWRPSTENKRDSLPQLPPQLSRAFSTTSAQRSRRPSSPFTGTREELPVLKTEENKKRQRAASPFSSRQSTSLQLLLPPPLNSRAPLPSPGRSYGGRVRACWPRGGSSTTALARGWLFDERKTKSKHGRENGN